MDFNQSPYFDDFNEYKNFYKILFKPSIAVQTREINQLQSILQNQITRFGNHIFKEGSMVIPGEVKFNDKLNYIKISSTNLGSLSLTDLEDLEISTSISGTGVKAKVIKAIAATGSDPITLIILYTSSDEGINITSAKEFSANQTLYLVTDPTVTLTVQAGSGISGKSICASIADGIYYINGYFVSIAAQTITVQKYVTDITNVNCKIGIQYTESIITEEDDSSLYDNAAGAPNYAAPGAHRYNIEVEFIKTDLTENPENFFELGRIQSGVTQVTNTSQYNILEETLARRTYDESGNYVVEPFKLDIKEHRNNDRGAWASETDYLVDDVIDITGGGYFICIKSGKSALTQNTLFTTADETSRVTDGTAVWRYIENPRTNSGVYLPSEGGNSSNLVLNFGSGKAYVQGYEINRNDNYNITISKSRDLSITENKTTPVPIGTYVILDKNNTYGLPSIDSAAKVKLYDRDISDTSGSIKIGLGKQVGTARVKFIDSDASGGLKLGLCDIKMEPDKLLDRDVNTIAEFDATGSTTSISYKLSGYFRYSGANSSYIEISGTTFGIQAAANSSDSISLSGVGTYFTREFTTGDTLRYTTGATSVLYSVVSVTNNTSALIRLNQAGTAAAVANTTTMVQLNLNLRPYCIQGIGSSSALSYELRIGDTITYSSSSVQFSSTVLRFTTSVLVRNRLFVNSNYTTSLNVTGSSLATMANLYVTYSSQATKFISQIYGNYGAGVNTFKLTGNYSIYDVDGATAINPTKHQAVKLVAGNDARLLTEILYENDLVDINGYRIYITKRLSNKEAYGICLNSNITPSATTYPAFLLGNKVYDVNNNSLLYKLNDAVGSLLNDEYQIYKSQTTSIAVATSSINVSISNGAGYTEAAFTYDAGDYLVSVIDSTSQTVVATVNSVTAIVGGVNLQLSTSVVGTVRVVFGVERTATTNTLAGSKSKTLSFDQGYEVLSSSTTNLTEIILPHADVYRINKILMCSTGFVDSWTAEVQALAEDITNNYILDDGQRDTYYDYSRIKLAPGYPVPSGSIKVFYDYFVHGSGDYFCYSSYSNTEVPYEKIPTYKGQKLRNYIDFRPLLGSSNPVNTNVPYFGSVYTADVGQYLARKEKVLLNKKENLYNIASVPAINPSTPNIINSDNSLDLYDITLTPYTDSSEWPDVSFTAKDNRRYTMKDIGELDRRIGNLEEVTTLNMLELQTKALQIRDNTDSTLERFKTGFFVDNFTDQSNAANVIDNRFSIDPINRTMNPHISTYSLPLLEKINYETYSPAGNAGGEELTPINDARSNQNYMITGDYITLPYTTSALITQDLATTSVMVAPFLVSTFIGNMKLFPSTDIHEDVTILKINNDNPENANRLAEAQQLGQRLFGSQYRISTNTQNNLISSTKEVVQVIPFCRANTIAVVVTGLKPNTKFYTFIDDIDVRDYITGAVKFTMNSVDVLNFNNTRPNSNSQYARWRSLSTTDVQKNRPNGTRTTWRPKDYDDKMPSQKYGDSFKKGLEAGVAVYYTDSAGKGSGVAMYQDGTTLYLVNARGRLSPKFIRAQTNDTYNYSGTFEIGATGAHTSTLPTTSRTAANICMDDESGNLYSDDKGTLVFLIDFPNNDTRKFLTGRKQIVVTDDSTNDPDNWTTRAEATYEVSDTKVNITNTYVSTKTFSVSRVINQIDPVAQSFRLPIEYENGAFITGVSFYFQQAPVNEDKPIFFEIRSCDSTGRPSPDVVPGSRVTMTPADINVDSSTASRATIFTFDQPVYLLPNKTYALVLKADTKNYRIWIANLGQSDVGTPTKTYSTQTMLGSFFRSQNDELWTEDQMADMKFIIHRANFKTVDEISEGVVYLVNQNPQTQQLPPNPFTFIHGSKKVRVNHPNHGFRNGDFVRFHSTYWTDQYSDNNSATIAGIPVTDIFGTTIEDEQVADNSDMYLTVESANLDNYVVTVSSIAIISDAATTAETTRVDGGTTVFANSQVLYHAITPKFAIINFDNTSLNFVGRAVKGHTYDNLTVGAYTDSTIDLDPNVTNFDINYPRVILTNLNAEILRYAGSSVTAGASTETWYDSFICQAVMSTESDHVSPVIDLSSTYIDLIQHRIDKPTKANRLGGETLPAYGTTSTFILYKTILQSSATVTFNSADSSITTTIADTFDSVVPGRYITISGSANTENNNTSTGIRVTGVTTDGKKLYVAASLKDELAGSSVTIRMLPDYTSEETLTDASGESKYINRIINLESPANALKILVDANIPPAVDIELYYKIGSASQDFNALVWKKFSNMPTLTRSSNRNQFTEVEIDVTNFDSLGYPLDLPDFTAFQIKFVMLSTNAAQIPIFKNLRVIAHA